MSTFDPLVAETASSEDATSTATFLKYWTMGVILSAIAYGVTFTLSISTLSLIHKSSRNKKERRHYVLISYVVVMIILATVSIVSGIGSNLDAIYTSTIPANLNVGRDVNAIIIVLVIWGSDGFLLWRAAILLHEGTTSTFRRAILWAFLGILMLAQIATGILYALYNFIPAMGSTKFSEPIFIAFASTTLTVNWFITCLVVFRVGQFRRRVSTTLGKNYGRPFKRVMVVCVESAVLIIVFSTIMLANNLQGESPFSLSRLLLIQIYIIAPLLILHRVTQDNKPNVSNRDCGQLNHRRRSAALGFQDSPGLPTNTLGENLTWSKTVEVQISRDIHKSTTNDDGDDVLLAEMDRPRIVPMTSPS